MSLTDNWIVDNTWGEWGIIRKVLFPPLILANMVIYGPDAVTYLITETGVGASDGFSQLGENLHDVAPAIDSDTVAMVIDDANFAATSLDDLFNKMPADLFAARTDVVGSIGIEDEIDVVHPYESVFDPVVAIRSAAGDCTGTVARLPTHMTLNNDALVFTAAHCVHGADLGSFTIAGNFLSEEGGVVEYTANVVESWVHPFHQEYRDVHNRPDYSEYAPFDVAILRVQINNAQGDFRHASFIPTDFDYQVFQSSIGQEASCTGFSGNMDALGTDEDCTIVDQSYEANKSDGDIQQRASGGPLAQSLEGSLRYLEGTTLEITGINAAVYPGDEFALHSTLDANFLATIPFVVPVEDVSFQCGAISEFAGANMRLGPSTEFARITAVADAHPVVSFGDIQQENGEIWHLIATSETPEAPLRYGYIRSDLLELTPCPGQ